MPKKKELKNLSNLAKIIDSEKLGKIGTEVVQNFEDDLHSRSEWEKKMANVLKLFAGYRDAKNVPMENASNVCVPIIGVAALQFQARAYEALLPSKEIAKCWSTDGKSIEQAKRCEKFLNYQLSYQMEEWEEEMDILLLQLPLFGSAYKKTYYDPQLNRNVSKVLSIYDFVAPYNVKRIEDATRKTHCFNLTVNDIKIRQKDGIYLDYDWDDTSSNIFVSHPAPQIDLAVQKIIGITPSASTDTNGDRLILEQHCLLDLDDDGIKEPYVVTVDYETRRVLKIISRLYYNPVTQKKEIQEYFTAYTFIPNPESHYGFGFGHFLEGLNETANTVINQLLDAGKLSNYAGSTGIINKRSGLKKSQFELKLGQFIEAEFFSDDIRKSIWNLPFSEPSPALFNLLGLIQNYAKEISAVSESMMGKIPPSDTTATSMMAVMEQGLKVFSTIHKRIHRSFKKELKKIAYLNSLYINEKEFFLVQDSADPSTYIQFTTGKNDFSNNIDIIPTSDPNITSRAEKLIKAQQTYNLGIQNPLIANNPDALYELTKMLLEAMEISRIDLILKKPQPLIPQDISPDEENAGFLKENGAQIVPDQDHMSHLDSHIVFSESSWGEKLTPQGKKLLEFHIREHLSAAYLIEQRQKEVLNESARGQGTMANMEISSTNPEISSGFMPTSG